ncbi:GMC family oxidoreductase [Alteromonas sp. NFXS44]|uniref:GMC family oxidoreductase n=1 Tax=Alteromonas sp. NFXS44 TaxID=2818435 RepID=UPI0032DFA788
MKNTSFEAIVIGSGISGGWAAKELCEKGIKTLMLERGKDIKHREDYHSDFTQPWETIGKGKLNEDILNRDYPVQQKSHVINEYSHDRFIKDPDNPYIQTSPFAWIRGHHTGGKSIMWGRQSYRLSELNLSENQRDGHGSPWPVRYSDLDPWYSYVEEFAGISGNNDGIDVLPDGNFLKPMEMNCLEKHVSGSITENFPVRRMIIGRAAHLTETKPVHEALGRSNCMYRNQCVRGCSFGGYFSTQSATLPAARNTGNLTLMNNKVVLRILHDEASGRATGVEVVDQLTMEKTQYFARVVFVCASTLGSTQILLNSASSAFPRGLGNSSGVLGHYLMDHNIGAIVVGQYSGFEDKYYKGRRPNGIYIPRFQNIGDDKRDFLRGYGFQGGASRTDWAKQAQGKGFGKTLKEKVSTPGDWSMVLVGFGEMLPDFNNKVTLNTTQKDKWGMPLLNVDAKWGENEHKMTDDMIVSGKEMLEAAGLTQVFGFKTGSEPGTGIHEMGTARMGDDPTQSVLNKFNQMHDVKNVFVTDGSAMVSTACQNPSLTYMAMTARAVDYAVKEMRAGRI